jgi:hypothetical protein
VRKIIRIAYQILHEVSSGIFVILPIMVVIVCRLRRACERRGTGEDGLSSLFRTYLKIFLPFVRGGWEG